MSRIIYYITSFFCLTCLADFDPREYRSLLAQTEKSIQSRMSTIDDKVNNAQRQLQDIATRKIQPRFIRRKEQINYIVDANKTLISNLGQVRANLVGQLEKIKAAEQQIKNKAVADRAQEAQLIGQLRHQLRVSDINQQILQTHQSERFLLRRQPRVAGQERKTISQMIDVLRKERAGLTKKFQAAP